MFATPSAREGLLVKSAFGSQAFDTYTYSNSAWTPATPTVAVGEGVLVVGPSGNQPCVSIYCPSDVHVASPDGSPVNVPYTAMTSNSCGLGPVKLTCSPATPGASLCSSTEMTPTVVASDAGLSHLMRWGSNL